MFMTFIARGTILLVTTLYGVELLVWTVLVAGGVPSHLGCVAVKSRVSCSQRGRPVPHPSQRHHMLEYLSRVVNGANIWWKGGIGGHEKMSPSPASCFELTVVQGIAMGGEYHVACSVHDNCIKICCYVV